MWIESHETCSGCGAEVTLVNDGRYAYGYVDASADTDVVWRDGQSLKLQCPNWTIDENPEPCGTEVTFNGEGNSIDTTTRNEPYYARPILEEAP